VWGCKAVGGAGYYLGGLTLNKLSKMADQAPSLTPIEVAQLTLAAVVRIESKVDLLLDAYAKERAEETGLSIEATHEALEEAMQERRNGIMRDGLQKLGK
jgi:hypothetical protein